MVEQTPPRKRTLPRGISALTLFALGLAFVFYWIVAHQIQGVDLQGWLPVSVEQLINDYPLFDPILPIIDFAVEMVSPTVLIHMFAGMFGIYYGRRFTISLVKQLYDLPDDAQAQRLLTRLQIPPSPYMRPLPLDRRRFVHQRRDEQLLSIGGPGSVNISESDVAVTEINGRFERVLGFGRKGLRRFERIVAVLDLRDQDGKQSDVTLMTKEGFQLKTDLHIQFRIKRRESARANQIGYTFDEESVRKAAYYQVVTGRGINRWTTLPLMMAGGQLRAIVGQKSLDELIDPNKIYTIAPQPEVQQTLKVRVQQILSGFGIELVDLRYTNLRLAPEMEAVMLEYWKAFKSWKPGPQKSAEEQAEWDMMISRRAREKMIQSLASGIATVRERKLREAARPDTTAQQQIMQQMLQTMQILMANQQQQLPPPGPPPIIDNNVVMLQRGRVNHLVWQLIDELENTLAVSPLLTAESVATLIKSPRLRLRMREAVTFQAKPAVGSALQSAQYSLTGSKQIEIKHGLSNYDTLVMRHDEMDVLARQLIKEAATTAAEELQLSAENVAQLTQSPDLSDCFKTTVTQYFLPPPSQSSQSDFTLPSTSQS